MEPGRGFDLVPDFSRIPARCRFFARGILEFGIEVGIVVMVAGLIDFVDQNHGMMPDLELLGDPKPVVPVFRPHVIHARMRDFGMNRIEVSHLVHDLPFVQNGRRADDVADGHDLRAEINGHIAIGDLAFAVQIAVPDGVAKGEIHVRMIGHEPGHDFQEVGSVHVVAVQVTNVPAPALSQAVISGIVSLAMGSKLFEVIHLAPDIANARIFGNGNANQPANT